MISDFRNSTLRFVRSNYFLYIDNFKHEVVGSEAQDRKYFAKKLFKTFKQHGNEFAESINTNVFEFVSAFA